VTVDPVTAVEQLPLLMQSTRPLVESRFQQQVQRDNTRWYVYERNGLGILYPNLPYAAREAGLRSTLQELDQHNVIGSQADTEYIDEPLLLADITINRSIYWAGFKHLQERLKQSEDWQQFVDSKPAVRGLAQLAWAIAYGDGASQETREHFYENNPILIDHTQTAIANKIGAIANQRRNDRGFESDVYIAEHVGEYDPVLQNSIMSRVIRRGWIDIRDRIY
jgi:hypothetical protein